ncbi:MAG: histidinol-phosphate transaminase [Candidatus Hecatellaceae archaeon]
MRRRPAASWVRDEIRSLEKVEHGGEAWRYLGSKEILDFSSNVNPLGASPKVLKVLRESLRLVEFLPDSDSASVREAAAEYLGRQVKPFNIIVGNGSTELIHLFALTFVKRGEECLIPVPTFGEYEAAVRKAGGWLRFLRLKASADFALKISEILRSLKPRRTKAVFICNPNNPTGQAVSKRDLMGLLDETLDMGVMVFLDESYVEFSGGDSLAKLVDKYPNLFVLRSLTKAFGLMGLRVGYGVASEELVEFMSKAKMSWSVNVLAQAAAVAALKDKSHLEKARGVVERERKFLFRELRKVKGFHVLPTKANFFLVNVEDSGFDASNLKERLLEHRILVRDCSSIRGLDGRYIRISVRRRWENKRLLEALISVLEGGL